MKQNKVKKEAMSKQLEESLKKAEEEIDRLSDKLSYGREEQEEVQIKASKPISQLKKGDKIKIDDLQLEIDVHYVLIDHGSTKEMVIELFDSKKDTDYQLRYFSDQVERTLELYELQEIMYLKKPIKKVEW